MPKETGDLTLKNVRLKSHFVSEEGKKPSKLTIFAFYLWHHVKKAEDPFSYNFNM